MADTTALKNRIRAAIKANDNQEITGPVLQQSLLDIVDELDLNPELENEAQQRQNGDTQLNNLIAGIKNNIDSGYVYAGIATPSTVPVSGKVFYIATAAGTYTNFSRQVLTKGINILSNNGSAWNHQQLIGIDNEPTAGSVNLVTSGGIAEEFALGAVYDVSAKNPTAGSNNDGKWESLSALLSDANLNTLIPTSVRKGGMSIKFVQSSDNKYVQYFLTKNEWSANADDWQKMNLKEDVSQLDEESKQAEETFLQSFEDSVGKLTREPIIWGETRRGYYWNLVNDVAGQVYQDMTYHAKDNLVDVTPGQILLITLHNTEMSSSAAYGAYDENLLPFNGVSARIDFINSSKLINQDGTVTYTFSIPKNCKKIGLFWSEKYDTEPYKIVLGRSAEWSNKLLSLIDSKINEWPTFVEMVGYKTGFFEIPWEELESNCYWNLVNGYAGLVSRTPHDGYEAKSALYPVTPGMLLRVTQKDAYAYSELTAAAYAIYDNDELPADGSSARRNWNSAISIVDNEDGTHTFTFLIEQNGTQIGIFYKKAICTFYIGFGTTHYNYSSALDQHIEEIAGGGETTTSDSSKYYLKGSSPKSFSGEKKIAIISAGQSNIDGRVPYANMPAEIQSAQPIANCNYVKNSENSAFAPINITGLWGFDLVTYYNLCVTANKEIYVIKWSQGGTSIDPLGDSQYHWTADYEKLTSETYSLLLNFEREIRNHVASVGEQFDIRAMLWHQGEGDRASLGTGSADRYYMNLRNMISYIRGIVGNERLPFITGTISHHSGQYDAKIEVAQQRLAQEDPYFYLIDMSGAPLLDSYHFNAASSVYFGQMAYNALIDYEVLTGTKLTPVRPW